MAQAMLNSSWKDDHIAAAAHATMMTSRGCSIPNRNKVYDAKRKSAEGDRGKRLKPMRQPRSPKKTFPTSGNEFSSSASVCSKPIDNNTVGTAANVAAILDPLAYTMEVFDKLILPNMLCSQSFTSQDLIRKCLYRKFFEEIANKEFQSVQSKIDSVEELLPFILSISRKAGLLIV